MDISTEVKEYQVLGHNFRLQEYGEDEIVSATEIVEYVDTIASNIRQKAPSISNSQLAALVALELAKEKLSLEKEYKQEITDVMSLSDNALRLIEESLPKTH
ncbi:cell division protein ZapA [Halobacteriovorax sp. Y22]|uniref:cell division protein ZapA n=1 Tax=Halobacteriovorax sp. Y22 TaxID=2505978 RepID=UPI001080D939|nr:cell division protein ZapA [Halobacteriovorax sp. Y22]TGD47343.1 cell division protein ZapA [Halobacteriovorax sp. Y22]